MEVVESWNTENKTPSNVKITLHGNMRTPEERRLKGKKIMHHPILRFCVFIMNQESFRPLLGTLSSIEPLCYCYRIITIAIYDVHAFLKSSDVILDTLKLDHSILYAQHNADTHEIEVITWSDKCWSARMEAGTIFYLPFRIPVQSCLSFHFPLFKLDLELDNKSHNIKVYLRR